MDGHILLMKTLADPTRMKLLKLVLREELCGCELQELLQISQPAVSQHVAKLKHAALITERKAGMWTYYRGDADRLQTGLGELSAFVATPPEAIPEMAELVERRTRLNRAAMCADEKGERCK